MDEIVFLTYQNPDTMTQDLKLGTLDAAWGLPQAQYKQLQATPGLEALSYNYRNWDYLDVNCYEGKASLGHPVLRDPAFRQALDYAIDRDRLVSIAWSGNAEPGTTIMTPNTWFDPDYHWQPPADQLYSFDAAKAGADARRRRLHRHERRRHPRVQGQGHHAAPRRARRRRARAERGQADHGLAARSSA